MRAELLAVLALLGACDSSTGGAGAPPSACATLPTCSTPEPASAAYGTACSTGFIEGWAGGDGGPGQPSCCIAGQRYAACIRAALADEACDPMAPASCVQPFTCPDGTCEDPGG